MNRRQDTVSSEYEGMWKLCCMMETANVFNELIPWPVCGSHEIKDSCDV